MKKKRQLRLPNLIVYNKFTNNSYSLATTKILEYDIFMSFLDHNPELIESYKKHKTYEILKKSHGNR